MAGDNIYIYCGHGTGRRYFSVRLYFRCAALLATSGALHPLPAAPQSCFRLRHSQASQVRAQRVRAAVLLMGCSSGALHPAGSYEPIGMALRFVGSGAPATVANLWDVTDGDIDHLTKTVLEVGCRVAITAALITFDCAPFPLVNVWRICR